MKVVMVILKDINGWVVIWLIFWVVVVVVIELVLRLFSVVCNIIVLIVMIDIWKVMGNLIFRWVFIFD